MAVGFFGCSGAKTTRNDDSPAISRDFKVGIILHFPGAASCTEGGEGWEMLSHTLEGVDLKVNITHVIVLIFYLGIVLLYWATVHHFDLFLPSSLLPSDQKIPTKNASPDHNMCLIWPLHVHNC